MTHLRGVTCLRTQYSLWKCFEVPDVAAFTLASQQFDVSLEFFVLSSVQWRSVRHAATPGHNVKNVCTAQQLRAEARGLLRPEAGCNCHAFPHAHHLRIPHFIITEQKRQSTVPCPIPFQPERFYCTESHICKDNWNLFQSAPLQWQTMSSSVREKLWCEMVFKEISFSYRKDARINEVA